MRLYLIQVREERIILSQPENLQIKRAAGEGILMQGEMQEGGHWSGCFLYLFCKSWGPHMEASGDYESSMAGKIWAESPHLTILCEVPHSKECHSSILKYDWHFFECRNSQHVQPHVVSLWEDGVVVCAQLHSGQITNLSKDS